MSDSNLEKDFIITRTFDAPRELVFQAWTDPKHLARWWGPRICTCPVSEMDARAGGLYRITMQMSDGVEFPIRGEFLTVTPPEKLVMTMDCTEHPATWHDMVKPNRGANEKNPAGILVMTATFDEAGGRTKLTVRIRFESPAIGEAFAKMGMHGGWSQSLDRLEENLATDALAMSATADREIITTRVLNAPRDIVWDAWTDPAKLVKWWGPDGFSVTMHEMDVRPGGTWRFVMHGPDGTDYKNQSTYIEVVKPERISYEHLSGPKFRAVATFVDLGDRTRVTLRMRFDTAEERNHCDKTFGAVDGAKQTLNRLAGLLAQAGHDCFPHEIPG